MKVLIDGFISSSIKGNGPNEIVSSNSNYSNNFSSYVWYCLANRENRLTNTSCDYISVNCWNCILQFIVIGMLDAIKEQRFVIKYSFSCGGHVPQSVECLR